MFFGPSGIKQGVEGGVVFNLVEVLGSYMLTKKGISAHPTLICAQPTVGAMDE